MTERKQRKLSVYQRNLLTKIVRDGGLMLTHADDGKHYCTCAGSRVNQSTAASLIARGALVPNKDSLFGDAQTYHPAD